MTRGSYFQNYANLKNHTTNNTLLILRHVYQASPAKLAKILGELLEQEIPIGPSFQQQVRIEESIPDGHISQAGIQLYIETKTAGKLWRDQIERHVRGIAPKDRAVAGNAGRVFLIGLTKERERPIDILAAESYGGEHGVVFKSLTFSGLVDTLRSNLEKHETELLSIVEDYENSLQLHNLLDDREDWIAFVACGRSLQENERNGIY